MILIVDGPDLAGKSTIINEIRKITGCSIYKGRNVKLDQMEETIDLTSKMLYHESVKLEKTWVCDRYYYPCDVVYSDMFGRESKLRKGPILQPVIQRLQKAETGVVIISANLQTLCSRYKKLGDYYIEFDQLAALKSAYENWATQHEFEPFPTLLLFSDAFATPEAAAKAIIEWAGLREEAR